MSPAPKPPHLAAKWAAQFADRAVVTYGLAGHADTIDALDPSVAMLHAAKQRKG
jgi:hypothetical protein